MKKHVFISYSSENIEMGNKLCEVIENNGYECWIAPRDIESGKVYAKQIMQGIEMCDIFVLLLCKNADSSEHVKNEVSVAFDNKKLIIPVFLEEFRVSDELEYYTRRRQWIVAYDSLEDAYTEILKSVEKHYVIIQNNRVNSMNYRTAKSISSKNMESDPINKANIVDKVESRNKIPMNLDTFIRQKMNLSSQSNEEHGYIPPYISEEMKLVLADKSSLKNVEELKVYDCYELEESGYHVDTYKFILSEKIVRDDKNLENTFELLSGISRGWRVMINECGQLIGYWIFVSLYDEVYDEIKNGNIDEMDIGINYVRNLDFPGRYKGYILLSGTVEHFRVPKVIKKLYGSWVEYLEELADEDIYFDEISTMVASIKGISSMKNIGMRYHCEYNHGGKMFCYDMTEISQNRYLSSFEKLKSKYASEFN